MDIINPFKIDPKDQLFDRVEIEIKSYRIDPRDQYEKSFY